MDNYVRIKSPFFNIGIDIEEIDRFKNINNNLLKKILTKNEIKTMKNGPQQIAGVFSAKEAVIKALNPIKKLNFMDIEINHYEDGSPYASIRKLKKISKENIKISVSHSGKYTTAVAIFLK